MHPNLTSPLRFTIPFNSTIIMIRFLVHLAFLFILTASWSQEKADSTKAKLEANGTISINSNGIAYIPAFSLDKPAIIATFSLAKNRFSYDPQFSYGFDLKPWIIDNWFHYKLIDRPEFELRTGINIAMFFSEYKTPDEIVWQGQRYVAFELAGTYKPSRTSSIGLMVWYDKGLDHGTITGYFINLVADRSDIGIGKHILMGVNIQTFYVDYTDYNDGLFISPKISFSSRDIPAFIFFQGIQPLISNISPAPVFQWNVGIGYSF